MSRFEEDKYREEVLGEFLETQLYPKIASDFERVTSAKKQKLGHDVRISFNWLDRSVIADEKAQNSDMWINNANETFVMEIFGESWFSNGNAKGNIGWFVNEDIQTEYYVMVWLPDVSIFKIESGVEGQYMVYQPADSVRSIPDEIAEDSESSIRYKWDSHNREARLTYTPDTIEAFENNIEPVPDIIRTRSDVNCGEGYYDPKHIYEAKVAIVQKEKVRQTLADEGLTRDVLLKEGRRAIKTGEVELNTGKLDTDKAKYIKKSSGKWSGSSDSESPVVLVVPYRTYDEIADATFHYVEDNWSEDVKLF